MAFILHSQVLQARGKSYHPSCFRCVVCRQSLEDQPFSVGTDSRIYCISDYHKWVSHTGSTQWDRPFNSHFREKMKPNPVRQAGDESHPEWLHCSVSVTCFWDLSMVSGSELLCVLPAGCQYCRLRWAELIVELMANSSNQFLRDYHNNFPSFVGCFRGLQSLFEWCHLTGITM